MIIGGLTPEEIIVSKEALMPMKDIVDSFCIMYAAANNRLENSKAYELMKIKQSTLLENFLLTVLKKVMKLLIWVLIVQLVTVRHMKLLNVF